MSFWRKQPVLKGYVSEIDRFLQEFDQNPDASSASRRFEEAKAQRISRLRDGVEVKESPLNIWEGFHHEVKNTDQEGWNG